MFFNIQIFINKKSVMGLIEKYIDKHGQKLVVPKKTVNVVTLEPIEIFEKKEVVVLLEDGRQLLT
jgi:hypothetical protein